MSAGQLLGVATYLHGAEAAPIRPSEVEFLARLTSLVSLALENSRLQKRADEERLRAAGSLARSEAIYRAIARSFPNGAIYVFDHDLRYQVVEGEALNTFGQTREDLAIRRVAKHGFRFDGEGTEHLRVPADVVTAVYRTVQEAVANVFQHAQASEVTLSLSRAGDSLIVSLADNGVGFDPAVRPGNGRVGLIGMRERIQSVGGRLDVSSSPAGTQVRIEVPVSSKVEA